MRMVEKNEVMYAYIYCVDLYTVKETGLLFVSAKKVIDMASRQEGRN